LVGLANRLKLRMRSFVTRVFIYRISLPLPYTSKGRNTWVVNECKPLVSLLNL
jgi:hypothetical protein